MKFYNLKMKFRYQVLMSEDAFLRLLFSQIGISQEFLLLTFNLFSYFFLFLHSTILCLVHKIF